MKTDEEKKEILLRRFEFPCRVVMYLEKENQEFTILLSGFKDKKKKLENVRFNEVRAFTFGGFPITPINIGDYETVDNLLDAIREQEKEWLGKEEDE